MEAKGSWSSSARYLLLTMAVIAALGVSVATPARAQNTYFGTNAGASGQGTDDAGFGFNVLKSEAAGSSGNTAIGWEAMQNNSTGDDNTASGALALFANTTGSANTASGEGALSSNTTGTDNTASGFAALVSNTIGGGNTAYGEAALSANTSGNSNVATGIQALLDNTTGSNNTASGNDALMSNTTGSGNTAAGVNALGVSNGGQNTADGNSALLSNTSGDANTATGTGALSSNTSGSSNIAVGLNAGSNLTTGDNNIDIGNAGVAAEAGTVRIGTQGTHTSTFIAGIAGSPLSKSSASVVLIDSTGHLGVQVSSARYKRDIHDVGDSSDGLLKLRPVSYRYKQDPTGSMQYGLIAEEVEQVYPELVTHTEDGKVQGVRYDLLPALLINEIQKQASDAKRKDAQIAELKRQVEAQRRAIAALKKKDSQIDALAERMSALEQQARTPELQHLASTMP